MKKNPEVEVFLKKNSVIAVVDRHTATTYLIFSNKSDVLCVFFTLTIKPFCFNVESVSKNLKNRKKQFQLTPMMINLFILVVII